jgi:hypothetical protein
MIKRVPTFLEGIACKHLLAWAFFCQSAFTFRNIYRKCSCAGFASAKKIAIENSLLSKLPHNNIPRVHFGRQKVIKKDISQFDGHQQ